MPRFGGFPGDYDYDYDYDYDASGASNVTQFGGSNLFGPTETAPFLTYSQFPRRYWDPQLYALAAVVEFADTGWKTGATSIDPGPVPATVNVEQELRQLAAYGFDERNALLPEILKQRANMAAYWLNLLMFSRKSHPATFDLVNIVLRVGQFAAMHFKKKYNRPRPSQLSPRIFPIIAVPGHPAYPSGHATEGHLLSRCLRELVPAAQIPLEKLAARVALNREKAGVHYPSDSEAGKRLSEGCFARLQTCDTYNEVLEAARKEW